MAVAKTLLNIGRWRGRAGLLWLIGYARGKGHRGSRRLRDASERIPIFSSLLTNNRSLVKIPL
jgi:hypothetical protein